MFLKVFTKISLFAMNRLKVVISICDPLKSGLMLKLHRFGYAPNLRFNPLESGLMLKQGQK